MTLVVMAAGMGSRYGGLKQMDPVGANNEVILDYSVYDAIRAGFDHVVFVVKQEIYDLFREKVGNRIARHVRVDYALQEVSDVPHGVVIPESRKKPWGTAHAVYACRELVNDPFLVINADDFYGKESFALVHDFLQKASQDEKEHYCLAGYRLCHTLTENGTVSRGECETDANGYLQNVTERTKILRTEQGIAYENEDGSWIPMAEDTTVSMNFWGFTPRLFETLNENLPKFFSSNRENLEKCEYYLPTLVKESMAQGICDVSVLKTDAKWYGITYHEDKAQLVKAVQRMVEAGEYPKQLWD